MSTDNTTPGRTGLQPVRRVTAGPLLQSEVTHAATDTMTYPPSIGTEEHFRWLKGIVVVILVLNVADAVLTLVAVARGYAYEANPLLAPLVHGYPYLFAVGKFLLVSLGAWLLWRLRRHPLAVVFLFVAFLAYYWLLIFHLRSLVVRVLGGPLG